MNTEVKQLLLKDLCAMLPYGVQCKISYTFSNETTFGENVVAEEDDTLVKIDAQSQSVYFNWFGDWLSIEDIKPYLRPMYSMTDEEREEWADLFNLELDKLNEIDDENKAEELAPYYFGKSHQVSIDWLNANHFDYRGLIEKGLALEAPEDMYKTD